MRTWRDKFRATLYGKEFTFPQKVYPNLLEHVVMVNNLVPNNKTGNSTPFELFTGESKVRRLRFAFGTYGIAKENITPSTKSHVARGFPAIVIGLSLRSSTLTLLRLDNWEEVTRNVFYPCVVTEDVVQRINVYAAKGDGITSSLEHVQIDKWVLPSAPQLKSESYSNSSILVDDAVDEILNIKASESAASSADVDKINEYAASSAEHNKILNEYAASSAEHNKIVNEYAASSAEHNKTLNEYAASSAGKCRRY